MNAPKLSIVTVTYKDFEGIKVTFESLNPLLESQISWEHIVVDSSPESTYLAIKDLPNRWPLNHVPDVPPKGVYAAMNHGIAVAKGDFIWILNGGDQLADVKVLENILSQFDETSRHDIICAGIRHVKEGKSLYDSRPSRIFSRSILGANQIPHPGMIYRQSVFSRVGVFNPLYKIAADYEHHFRCLIASIKVKCLQDILAIHDHNGLSNVSYRAAMTEVKEVHKVMRPQINIFLQPVDKIGEKFEEIRLSVVKTFANSRLSPVLRPLWLRWRRKK